jgi:hypothetical protein
MIDSVAQYLVQFTMITAGGMALSQWLSMPLGTAGSTRKRYNCLIYCIALGELGLVSGLVVAPSAADSWYKQLAFTVVMAVVSTGAAHLAVAIKQKKTKK